MFLPSGKCETSNERIVRKSDFVFGDGTKTFLIDVLNERAGIQIAYGTLFYVSNAVRYITRMNDQTKTHLERMVSETVNNSALKEIIGVQMRLGENGINRNRGDPELFARAAVQIYSSYGPFTGIWLTTDGSEQQVQVFKKTILRYGGQALHDSVKMSPPKYWQLTLPGMISPQGRAKKLMGQTSEEWDEAMSIHTEMYAIGQCGYVVSSMDSNVGRFLQEVQALRWGRITGLPFFDVTSTLYYGGWAASPFPHSHLMRGIKKIQDEDDSFIHRMGVFSTLKAFQTCTIQNSKQVRSSEMYPHFIPHGDPGIKVAQFREHLLKTQLLSKGECQVYEFVQEVPPRKFSGLGSRMNLAQGAMGKAIENGQVFSIPGDWL